MLQKLLVVEVMVAVVVLLCYCPSSASPLTSSCEQEGTVLTPHPPFPSLFPPPSLFLSNLDSNPGGDYAPLEGQWKDGLCDFPNQWSPSCLFSCFLSCLALAMLSKRTGMFPYW